MDFYRAAQDAGFKVISETALPSLASAASLFPSPPAGTRMIVFSVRGQPITVRGDGGTPTAGANGVSYSVGGPYGLPINDSEAANFKAIQEGATATGWVQYWGLP